jgi:phosphopantetheinyl transferase
VASLSAVQIPDAGATFIPAVSVFVRKAMAGQRRDRSLLVDAVAARVARPAQEIDVTSFCHQCGQDDHGRPTVCYATKVKTPTLPIRPALPAISLSRTDGLVAVALVESGAVGVDIETIDRFARADIDEVAFHQHERTKLEKLNHEEGPIARTILWAAKEAILKFVGTGLRTSPDLLFCDLSEQGVRLVSWPSELGLLEAPHVTITHIDERHVCAVAHAAGAATTFSWWPDDARLT